MNMELFLLPWLLVVQEPAAVERNEAQRANRSGQKLVFYEVQDLTRAWIRDFEGPEVGVSRPADGMTRKVPAQEGRSEVATLAIEEAGEPSPDQIASMALTLEQVVRTFMQPPIAAPTENVRATKSGTLVVNGLLEQQEWVEDFLEGLRTFEGLIDIQATIYSAPRGVLHEWGFAPSATIATPEALAKLLAQIAADERFEEVNAPRLMLFPCQRAYIAVIDQVSYVKSWQLQLVEPGAQEIADPLVEVIQEGVVLEARSSPLPGGRFGLQLELSSSEIARPIPTRKVRLSAASDQEAEIGEPEVKTARFEATVLLADGASAVLVTADTRPDKDLAVVVNVRKVAARRSERK